MTSRDPLQHIVYVSREYPPSPRSYGIGSYVKEAALALVNCGYEVTVLTSADRGAKQTCTIENGVRVIHIAGGDVYSVDPKLKISLLEKLSLKLRFFPYRWKIRITLQSLKNVSIVEVPEYGAEGLFLQNLGLPIVVKLHIPTLLDRQTCEIKKLNFKNAAYYWYGLLEFVVVKRAAFLSSCSASLKCWYVEKLKLQPASIAVNYNFLNLATEQLAAKKDAKISTPFVFYAGSVRQDKGVESLIEAVALLRNKDSQIRLVLAGKVDANYRQLLIEKFCLDPEWCKFTSHVQREELESFYSNATVCCLPSWYENFPYVCLEAMSVGGIVIGSENGGMPEIITEGYNGFLCPPHNSEQIASKIEAAMALSSSERAMISRNAQKTIEEKFSAKVLAVELADYYRNCIRSFVKQ
ncbi:MAG: glycosyltransferase family 4 protein [Thiolinea sp.]